MGGYAWVTLATNDSYSLGALVLAHSLKQVGTQQQLAVLVTPGVTNAMREKLSQVFNVIQEVNILDSKDEANLRLLKRPELGITFTKLHCWRLTQFDKCVFLDADTLVLENCDELFEREELSAAPDVGWPDCFNSGVFVYRPSNETYENLIQFSLERGSFDGGDQGLLNLYFSDWAHRDITKHLPFIYNMCSISCYSYLPAFKKFGVNAKIIHFIGATKPWLQYFDTESKKVHPPEDAQHLQTVLQQWWNIFCSLIHPNLTSSMSGFAGAFAQLTLGAPRTTEQAALDDHLRRQGWEVGNIDYLGRDSFENIWSKICETLSSVQEQISPTIKAPTSPASAEVKAPEHSTGKESYSELDVIPGSQPKPVKKELVLLERTVTENIETSEPKQNLPFALALNLSGSQTVVEGSKSIKVEIPQSSNETYIFKLGEVKKEFSSPERVPIEKAKPTPAVLESLSVADVTPETLKLDTDTILDSPISTHITTTEISKLALQGHPDTEKFVSLITLETPNIVSKATVALQKPTADVTSETCTAQEVVTESLKSVFNTISNNSKPAPEEVLECSKSFSEITPIPKKAKPPITPVTVQMPISEPSLNSIKEIEIQITEGKVQSVLTTFPKKETSTSQSQTATPESFQPASNLSTLESAPRECLVSPKPVFEKKLTPKKSKEAPEPPKAEVTEVTSPVLKRSLQPKQTDDSNILDISAATSETSSVTPTPPPRKGSGAQKKNSGKTKK